MPFKVIFKNLKTNQMIDLFTGVKMFSVFNFCRYVQLPENIFGKAKGEAFPIHVKLEVHSIFP